MAEHNASRPGRRALLTAALASAAALPAMAGGGDPDAELVANCNRLTRALERERALYADCQTIEQEHAVEEETDAIADEIEELHQVIVKHRPSTTAGVIAKARAALALAPQRSDGRVISTAGIHENITLSLLLGLTGQDHSAVSWFG